MTLRPVTVRAVRLHRRHLLAWRASCRVCGWVTYRADLPAAVDVAHDHADLAHYPPTC